MVSFESTVWSVQVPSLPIQKGILSDHFQNMQKEEELSFYMNYIFNRSDIIIINNHSVLIKEKGDR